MSTKNINNTKNDFKYVTLLAMIYNTFLMAATIAAYKIVIVRGYSTPASTLIYTFTFFLSNIFAECYGSYLTKKLIWQSVLCGYIFAFLLAAINLLPSPGYWNKAEPYNQVLGHIVRFTNAGVMGYLLGGFLNLYLFTRWKFSWNGRFFWLRNLLAASITEGIVTYTVGIMTFYNILDLNNILVVMTNAFLFKICYGLLAVIPSNIFASILIKKENLFLTKYPINPINILER